MSFSCFMELYTRYPFISRHLRFGWLHFTSFLKAAQSWLKTVHFMWRKTVQFYWLKSVYFILPLTAANISGRAAVEGGDLVIVYMGLFTWRRDGSDHRL